MTSLVVRDREQTTVVIVFAIRVVVDFNSLLGTKGLINRETWLGGPLFVSFIPGFNKG